MAYKQLTQSKTAQIDDSDVELVEGYKYKGIDSMYGKWRARININSKKIHLGMFNTEEEAAEKYNEAALKYHGAFARLNKVGRIVS